MPPGKLAKRFLKNGPSSSSTATGVAITALALIIFVIYYIVSDIFRQRREKKALLLQELATER